MQTYTLRLFQLWWFIELIRMQENLKLEEYCSRLFFGQELAAASGTITCDVTYEVFKKKKVKKTSLKLTLWFFCQVRILLVVSVVFFLFKHCHSFLLAEATSSEKEDDVFMGMVCPSGTNPDDSPLYVLCCNDTCSFTWTGAEHINQVRLFSFLSNIFRSCIMLV